MTTEMSHQLNELNLAKCLEKKRNELENQRKKFFHGLAFENFFNFFSL
jgi:hypothetical protein